MRLMFCCTLALITTANAGPTTRPRDIAPIDPPAVTFVGGVIDPTRPAFQPTFAAAPAASPLRIERDYAYRHSPPIFYSPYGYGFAYPYAPFGFYGYVNTGFYR